MEKFSQLPKQPYTKKKLSSICRNNCYQYEAFNTVSLLGHMGKCGRNAVQSEYRATRDMLDEIGDVFELPSMQVTKRDHFTEEIHVF